MYGLERFSEDLDFCLENPDPDFRWIDFKKAVELELKTYGLDAEFEAKKDNSESAIGPAFVKQSTLKGLVVIESKFKASKATLLKVRLELDKSNPPGATYEEQFLRQPELFRIRTLDMSPDILLDEKTLHKIYLEEIESVDFKQAVQDVSPYLTVKQIAALKDWNTDFFKALAPLIEGV